MKNEKSNYIKRIKTILLCYFFIYYIVVGLTELNNKDTAEILDAIFSFVGELSALFIILYGIVSHHITEKKVWKIISVVIILNIIGDAVWNINEFILRKEIPDVSISDIFYLPAAILLLAAVWILIRRSNVYTSIKIGMDISIIMIASTTLLYNFILMPLWMDENYAVYQKVILILYPILDLGYLTGILAYILNKKKNPYRNTQKNYFIAGFLLLFTADILFSVDNSKYLCLLYNPFWTMGYISLSLASLHTTENRTGNPKNFAYKEKKKEYQDYFKFLLPYIFACVFIILIASRYMFLDPLAFGSTITVLFIFLRQVFTMLENERLRDILEKTNQQLEENSIVLAYKNQKLNELKNLREQEAQTDFLTHLYNRRYLHEWLDQYVESSLPDSIFELSVLLIDVDHYKEVNDVFGHDTGDIVLQEVAKLIRINIRESDKASRYGGDEFVVVLPGATTGQATPIAERILNAVRSNIFKNNAEIKITLSIGIYYWTGTKSSYSFDSIIQAADEALYNAKKTGRDRIVVR